MYHIVRWTLVSGHSSYTTGALDTYHIEITSLFLMANVIAFAHTVFHRNKIDRYDSQIKMVKSPLNMTRVCINIMLNSREAPQI